MHDRPIGLVDAPEWCGVECRPTRAPSAPVELVDAAAEDAGEILDQLDDQPIRVSAANDRLDAGVRVGAAGFRDELDAPLPERIVRGAHTTRAQRDDARDAIFQGAGGGWVISGRLEPLDEVEARVVFFFAEREQPAAPLGATQTELRRDVVGPDDVAVVAQELEAESLIEGKRTVRSCSPLQ